MPSFPILAVHCGAHHVSFGSFGRGPEGLVLERFATKSVAVGDAGEDQWMTAVGAVLRDLVRKEEWSGRCVLGLPGHLTFCREFHVPAVGTRQRRKIVAFEQRQGMSAAGGEMVWSHAILSGKEGGLEMMLAVAKRRFVAQLGARMRESGLYPDAALPAWLVLRHAIGCGPVPPAGTLVLSIGTRSSQLVGAAPRGFSARTFAVGGSTVTQKIAEALQIDFATAEAIKLGGFAAADSPAAGERERAAVRLATEQFGRRLCVELLRSPPLLNPPDDPARPAVLWLAGGGARLPDLGEILAERLQLRVARWDLRPKVGPGCFADGPGSGPDDAEFIDLCGLAEYAAKGPLEEGNLLPRTFRREMFIRRRWPWMAAAAVLSVAAFLWPIWRLHLKAREFRRRTEEVDAGIAILGRLDARNRSNTGRLAETRRRVDALRRLAAARSDWTALFADLQEQFGDVEDVWLDRLQILAPDPRKSSGASGPDPTRSGSGLPQERIATKEAFAGVRLLLAGRMLDVSQLAAGACDDSCPRAESLLTALRASPLIAAVEHERFGGIGPGVWNFEITLRLDPDALL
jgi:type IV pilus assembly protein PilM